MKQRVHGKIVDFPDARRMLSAVVGAAPVGLAAIDGKGRIVLTEGHPFPQIGFAPGRNGGAPAAEIWAGFPPALDALARARAGETATATLVVGENAFEIKFLPLAGANGARILAIAIDVTARYAAMVQIPEREEFLQGILDTVVDGIVAIDELGLIRDVNPAAARIFGYAPAEIIGKTVTMLMPEPWRSAHDGYIRRYLQTGIGTVVGARREMVGLRKDGAIFPMELAVSELKFGDRRHFTGVVRDITERKAAERALRVSEERYALAARGANDGLWDWDIEAGTIYFSARWKAMLGFEDDEIGESPQEWLGRIHRDDEARVFADIEAHLAGRTATFQSEYRIRRKSGDVLRMLARGVAVRGADGKATRMAGSQADITERKRAEERLVHDALHDGLTGLPNRILLSERIGQALARIRRYPEMGFAVAALNLDRFRLVNESMGHGTGDDLLLSVARRLENKLRPGDTLARLGADNFAVLMEDASTPEAAREHVDRLRRSIAQPFTIGGREVFTSARFGIVVGEPGYHDATDMLRDAELAVSRAKRDGGGAKVAVFDQTLHSEAVGLMEAETDLRRAIERDSVLVYYQPVIALASGRIVGFEALARLSHPERGIIGPSEFIGIAEDTGLIVPLLQQVMSRACAQAADWQQRFGMRGGLEIAVNLSARNVADEGLLAMIERVLADTGLPATNLRVEITESLMMTNPELMAQMLERLKSLGIGLALDDFGTGYSSLSHLRRFPLDTLKIDRSFVSRMASEERDQELVRTIVLMAHALGLDVVAEGVETLDHVGILRDLGCEFAQGYHYAAPLPAAEAEAMLAADRAG